MMFPPVFKFGYTPMLPPLLAMLTWMAGLFLLWATRFTSTLHPRLGRGYYALSAVMRPLGIVLIGFGWLEVMGQSGYSSLEGLRLILRSNLPDALMFISLFFILYFGIMLLPMILFLLFTLPAESVHPELILFFWAFMFSMWSVFKLGIRRSFLYRKADEGLMTSGPYAMVRHPQLLAACLMAFCTYINSLFSKWYWVYLMGDTFLLINVFLFCVLTYIMIFFEERDLVKTFGDEYLEYKKKVPRIFPGFFPRWDRVCKKCGRETRHKNICDFCGGVIIRKFRHGFGDFMRYEIMLGLLATLLTYFYGVKDPNFPLLSRQNADISNRVAVRTLRNIREKFHDLGTIFQDPDQIKYQDEILMEVIAEELGFGIETVGIDRGLQDGVIFCLGDNYFQVENPAYRMRQKERKEIRAYAEKVCPKLSGFSSDGFTALAIGNIDFDPVIHVIGINDKSDVFCLANDLPRYQFSPPRESLVFPDDIMPYQRDADSFDRDALYGYPCEDPGKHYRIAPKNPQNSK